jgi:D-sedoheptulose 7-phosphate isomerase
MDFIDTYFDDSLAALDEARKSQPLALAIRATVEACARCLLAGGKIMLAGNGGSAGDAQHIAGEFLSRLNFDRAPLAAIALSTDTSVLTAVGNDYGYEKVFERQVLGLGRPGDVFIAISTSGRSSNILRALEAARSKGCTNIGVGGMRSVMADLCDIYLEVPSRSTPLIQQVYMVALHAICGEVERVIFSDRQFKSAQG